MSPTHPHPCPPAQPHSEPQCLPLSSGWKCSVQKSGKQDRQLRFQLTYLVATGCGKNETSKNRSCGSSFPNTRGKHTSINLTWKQTWAIFVPPPTVPSVTSRKTLQVSGAMLIQVTWLRDQTRMCKIQMERLKSSGAPFGLTKPIKSTF